MTIREFTNPFYDRYDEMKTEYKEGLEKIIKDNRLDGRVVRKCDGKEGVLNLDIDFCFPFRWVIKFYPITRRGEVSKIASGWISEYEELRDMFQPVEVSNDN